MNTQTNTLPAITLDGRTSLGVIYASDFATSTTDPLRDWWTEGKMKAVVDALDGRPVVIELGGGSGFALAGSLEGVVKAWPGRGPRVTVATINGTRTNYRLANVGMILEVAESITDGIAKYRALDLYRTRKQAAQDAVRDAFPDWLDGIDGWSIETNLFVDRAHVSVKGRGVLGPFRWWEVRLDGNVASAPVRRS